MRVGSSEQQDEETDRQTFAVHKLRFGYAGSWKTPESMLYVLKMSLTEYNTATKNMTWWLFLTALFLR